MVGTKTNENPRSVLKPTEGAQWAVASLAGLHLAVSRVFDGDTRSELEIRHTFDARTGVASQVGSDFAVEPATAGERENECGNESD